MHPHPLHLRQLLGRGVFVDVGVRDEQGAVFQHHGVHGGDRAAARLRGGAGSGAGRDRDADGGERVRQVNAAVLHRAIESAGLCCESACRCS